MLAITGPACSASGGGTVGGCARARPGRRAPCGCAGPGYGPPPRARAARGGCCFPSAPGGSGSAGTCYVSDCPYAKPQGAGVRPLQELLVISADLYL